MDPDQGLIVWFAENDGSLYTEPKCVHVQHFQEVDPYILTLMIIYVTKIYGKFLPLQDNIPN